MNTIESRLSLESFGVTQARKVVVSSVLTYVFTPAGAMYAAHGLETGDKSDLACGLVMLGIGAFSLNTAKTLSKESVENLEKAGSFNTYNVLVPLTDSAQEPVQMSLIV